MLGGLSWAFSDWMVFHLGTPQNPAAAPFPLLLLGLRRLARAPDRASVGITVAALVLSAIGGHPETLLFVSASTFSTSTIAQVTERVSVTSAGAQASARSLSPALSADGRCMFGDASADVLGAINVGQ